MVERLRTRQEWQLFGVLARADRRLAATWWTVLGLRGLVPALFAVAMGTLVATVEEGRSLAPGLLAVGVPFVLMQVMAPLHLALSFNLGDRAVAGSTTP